MLPPAADWTNLLRKGLEEWKVLGDGHCRIRSDGVVLAFFGHDRQTLFRGRENIGIDEFRWWGTKQSWQYTRRECDEYDLYLEYWVSRPGNSGISIRDPAEPRCGVAQQPDFTCTPSQLGYEIQINSEYSNRWSTVSIYGLARAQGGLAVIGKWNRLNIESRADLIPVSVNGEPAPEHPGSPARLEKGPIGLKLHDLDSFVVLRNVWILES